MALRNGTAWPQTHVSSSHFYCSLLREEAWGRGSLFGRILWLSVKGLTSSFFTRDQSWDWNRHSNLSHWHSFLFALSFVNKQLYRVWSQLSFWLLIAEPCLSVRPRNFLSMLLSYSYWDRTSKKRLYEAFLIFEACSHLDHGNIPQR